ncbi:MAG: DUF3240 family protein [Pseudohongiellaceae bacterium]
MLILNLSPQLEEGLVDYLLTLESVSGFTSYQVRGHGKHQNMSINEQVSGRRKRLQFEIMMEEAEIGILLAGLRENVGVDIVYWQQVVTNMGEITGN